MHGNAWTEGIADGRRRRARQQRGPGKAQRQGARLHAGAARTAPVSGVAGAEVAGAEGDAKCEERPRAITLGVGCVLRMRLVVGNRG